MAGIADLITNLKKKLKGGYNTVADALPLVPNTSQIKSFASNPVQFVANPSYNGGNNLYRTTPFQLGARVQNNIYQNAKSPDPIKNSFAKMYVNAGEAVRDYFDPSKTPTLLSKQGIFNYGKAVGLTALPVINMAMAPKVPAQTYLGAGALGAGFNAVLGNTQDSLARRMRYGATQGVQGAPLTQFVTGFSNPITNKIVSKIPLKNLAPKAKVIAEGVARGLAAIPEGMAINAAQRQPYTPLDLVLDVGVGSGLAGHVGNKLGDVGIRGYTKFTDWYGKNRMTSSQKHFASQGMVGNVRSIHPEDNVILERANVIINEPGKFPKDVVKDAKNNVYLLAEKYLPVKLQSDTGNAQVLLKNLHKRMANGQLQTFEGGFVDLNTKVGGKLTIDDIKADIANQAKNKPKGFTPIEDLPGTRSGLRAEFDNAISKKDITTIQKLLPDVPDAYKKQVGKYLDPLLNTSVKRINILKQPRSEKVALEMLQKGTIDTPKYNEIAGREGFKARSFSQPDLEKEVYLVYQKTQDFKQARNKFWELIGADSNNPNATKTNNQANRETSAILNKYQKNPNLLTSTQDIPNGRISDRTPQNVTSNTQSQAPSRLETPQPQQPPQQPKSGVSKIGQPPVKSSSQGIIDSTKNYVNQLYTQAVDRFHPLSQAAKRAGQDQAMRNAITQHYGAGSTATYHVDFELSPILKEVDANDLRSYTIAKRDLELAGRDIKGSDRATAQNVIDDLKQKYGADFANIETTANKLYSYQDSLVKKYLVDTGVISKQSYEAMRRNNQAYIPFKRVMDQVDGFLGVTPQTKSMGSVSSQGVIKKIKGSDRDIIDPLQSIIENTYKIVSVGQRNKVAKTIVSLKDQLPDLVKPFAGEVGNRQDIVSVFEDGKVQKYQVPKDVAEAAKGLNEESLNALIKILAVPSKLVRATATGINPEFLVPNVTRDVQSAFVNVGLNPLRFVSGVAHLVKKDQVYQDFLRSGGKTSSIMIDRPYLKKTVGDITGKPGIEALNPIRLLQTLGEYSEQPTRIAMFEQTKNKLIKKGLSVSEAEVRAANAAQEGTVNFARMGSKMKAANSLVTFLNARLQGADILMRNVKNNPAGTLFRLGLVTQIPAVLSYLYNRQFESYNDERVVSKYDKQANFILMLSDTPIESLGGAQFIKIPKGDVGRFANPTESFMSYLDGKGDTNTIAEIAKALTGLLPFQNIGDAIPAAIKPPIEWAANKSFFTGQPLVPEYKQALPAKYQYTSKTAPLYKIIGDKLNLSPAKLENTTAGYLTGFEKIGNTAFNAVTGQKPDSQQGSGINRVPVVRRFLGGEKRTGDEQVIMDDKKANSIDFQINDVKGAINRGDLPTDEGVKQIELLRQQQQDIRNKQVSVDVSGSNGKTYYFKDAEGKLKEINISSIIQAPTMTGNTELDKKLISKYNSAISRRANDIEALYSAGQMTATEAEKQLNDLVQKKISTAKGKTIKVKAMKKIKVPKIKLAKVKNVKYKMPKLKLAKAKAIKIKSLKTKSLMKLKA